jgi:hypothetical protein
VLETLRVERVASDNDAQSTHEGVHCLEDTRQEELVVRNVAMRPNRIRTSVYTLCQSGSSADRGYSRHCHMIGSCNATRTVCDLFHMSYMTHAAQRRESVLMALEQMSAVYDLR